MLLMWLSECFEVNCSGLHTHSPSSVFSLLKVHLQLRGLSVFIDVEKLEAGTFEDKLVQSVKRASNFLLVLSANALDKCMDDLELKDWVHKVNGGRRRGEGRGTMLHWGVGRGRETGLEMSLFNTVPGAPRTMAQLDCWGTCSSHCPSIPSLPPTSLLNSPHLAPSKPLPSTPSSSPSKPSPL